MSILKTLYKLSKDIDQSWTHREAVDWGEAEQLVSMIGKIPPEQREHLLGFGEILVYAEAHDEWDSQVVGLWPETICKEIDALEKVYRYREEAEWWEVYTISADGNEEWKATVGSEEVAIILVKIMESRRTQAIGYSDNQAG